MGKQQIGVIGLAVMGKNLALNIESRGYSVSVYNRSRPSIDQLVEEAKGKNIVGTYTLEEFVNSLETPRKIIIMIRAGQPVDDVIKSLKQYIEKGDLLIDCGNSFYMDTMRRSKDLAKEGYLFIGSGVSGGEEGALKGPSIMPGGPKEAYDLIEPVFTAISAKVDNDPCCTYIGTDGAGHYVKMVHNGIEYGDMQLISEAYSLLKDVLGLSNEELYEVFSKWNKGELNSYLIEITRDIFRKKDEVTSKPMLDVILDAAGQKGTGKWASKSALDLGLSTPTITEAVFARCISAIKEERVAASKILSGPSKIELTDDKKEFIEAVRQALYASKICSYAQGFALMRAAAKEYQWEMNYGNIAMIFRGGCIIRAQFLNKIKEAYDKNPNLPNLMLDSYFSEILAKYQEGWRKAVAAAIRIGIPVPAFSSALSYYDSYRREQLPANLLQAQRDYFGAHTYERVDRPRGEFYHTNWTGQGGTTSATTYT
ncbi:MAG TPA: phosphogluconate dehydrogenase (NADP(+)-dependent, decarboxylating), partial [Lachnospiraceae bacterium]|nr:phosphogluconate dehydrogenase (NADP(+)-dependent, decarboxylating) [Lachnospiraceae bacterium]